MVRSNATYEAVRTRCLAFQKEGYCYQKWLIADGPGSGPEGMRRYIELVRTLRETLADDAQIMVDSFSGWDLDYAPRVGSSG